MRSWIVLLSVALAACSAPVARPTPHPVSLFAPNTGAILTGAEALALSHQCSRPAPGPVSAQWIPTAAQIEAIEPNLGTVLRAHLAAAQVNAAVSDYYRQYAGFVVGGRRMIYVNGVERAAIEQTNPDHPFDWRRQATGICDGGAITFGVEYDVEAGEFSHFAFNGAI
jgi:hypothetical protein